jgi:hypothetical protein
MFLTLLVVTFAIALLVTFIVALVFRKSVAAILDRLLVRELSVAWQRYMTFAIYVVGISGGVRIWELEKYISPRAKDLPELQLNRDRWVLEVYRTVIETLQSVAWLLLAFFIVALVAYLVVEIGSKFGREPSRGGPPAGA